MHSSSTSDGELVVPVNAFSRDGSFKRVLKVLMEWLTMEANG
jgi:hypothetical protein